MLVLSRRPGEKILFPNVGIAVEIIRTKGNTVRVGIEAPEDIRVLRGELDQRETPPKLNSSTSIKLSSDNGISSFEESERIELSQRIDEIELALALAQNQQRQGVSEYVDIALDQAMDRLGELKRLLDSNGSNAELVCEPKCGYTTRRPATTTLEFPSDLTKSFRFEFAFELTV